MPSISRRFFLLVLLILLEPLSSLNADSAKPAVSVTPAPSVNPIAGTAETDGTDARRIPCWVAGEWEFQAANDYSEADAFSKVRLDVKFTSESGKTYVMPAFWDGGKTWRVRFAPVEAGKWSFQTQCSESSDAGLNAQNGHFVCVPYEGELAIYRHGFVTTRDGLKYFIFADGTPFFYLGDTHWNLFREELDEPGPHADGLKIDSHFRFLADRRAAQGFTVYQSEPIGKKVTYEDGISLEDVHEFQRLDRYFQYLAEKGFLHANAQFCFPSEMVQLQKDEAFLKLLTRYWVARYAAFPVLWTLGQEVDDDFYGKFSLNPEEQPYVKICRWIHELDPYQHPITAHQENTGSVTRTGVNGTKPSLFQNVPGHTWYGVQWSRPLNQPMEWSVPKDFWNDGKGKPAILYEGRYCFLWTKDFGARAQGWMAFLNGMFGYGYGAADIWLYLGTYDMKTTSAHDGVSAVTPEEKAIPWPQAAELPSAAHVGFMRQFLESHAWWTLVPEFGTAPNGTKMKFESKSKKVFRYAAFDGQGLFVFYFYSSARETGALKELTPGTACVLEWFDPQTGKAQSAGESAVSEDGSLILPEKPNEQDWVLVVSCQKKP